MRRSTPSDLILRHPLFSLAAVCGGAILAYLLLFALVLQRPLTLGLMGAMIAKKEAMAKAAGPGKIIIAAGSNGRYSHSCAVIGPALGRPCVNLSVTAGVGADALFQEVADQLRTGDLAYLPMEYPVWTRDRAQLADDDLGPWLFRNDRRTLWRLGPERAVRAAFSFDLRYGLDAIDEIALQHVGVQRRVGLDTLDPFGDETSNTPQAARAYAANVAVMPWSPPLPPTEGPAAALLARLVVQARTQGAVIVGGLPTTFDDQPIPPDVINGVRTIFRRAGADFVLLDNHSQYPRADFFDAPEHLQAPWQNAHSRAVAAALKPLLPQQ